MKKILYSYKWFLLYPFGKSKLTPSEQIEANMTVATTMLILSSINILIFLLIKVTKVIQ